MKAYTLLLTSFIYRYSFNITLSILVSVPAYCFNKFSEWTLSNQDYILGVLLCISVDHILGTLCHAFKIHDFSFKKNAIGIIKKISLCLLSIILFEIIYIIIKDVQTIYTYLKLTTRLIVISYPLSSAFLNMSILTNGKFPPKGLLDKLKVFNENLVVKI